MNVANFLFELRSRRVHVWADEGQLRCNAASDALTPELREELRLRKAEILEFLRSAESIARQDKAIVPLQQAGSRTPVFAVAGHNGDVYCYRALARHLGDDRPFFGLQPPGFEGECEPIDRVGELAEYFAARIRVFDPRGPYIIAGYCAGGAVAFELARKLQRGGAAIEFVALFGSPYPTFFRFPRQMLNRIEERASRIGRHAREIAMRPMRDWFAYAAARLGTRTIERAMQRRRAREPAMAVRARIEGATLHAVRRYTPGFFAGPVVLFLPCRKWIRSRFIPLRWKSVAQRSEEYFGPDGCDGSSMLLDPHVEAIARLFRNRCDKDRGG